MKVKISILTFLFMTLLSANAQSVLGKWKTFDDETGDAKSIVQITERDGKIYGKVIEILNPAKKDAKCINCSGTDKERPVLGLEVLKGLSKDGGEYSGGKILDPTKGKLYKSTISLDGKDKLKVRGYVGFSLLGRTQIWERVK